MPKPTLAIHADALAAIIYNCVGMLIESSRQPDYHGGDQSIEIAQELVLSDFDAGAGAVEADSGVASLSKYAATECPGVIELEDFRAALLQEDYARAEACAREAGFELRIETVWRSELYPETVELIRKEGPMAADRGIMGRMIAATFEVVLGELPPEPKAEVVPVMPKVAAVLSVVK